MSIQICPHAKIKWMVCSCNIVESVCPDMDNCDGQGTYSVLGNIGFGYNYQCNKVPNELESVITNSSASSNSDYTTLLQNELMLFLEDESPVLFEDVDFSKLAKRLNAVIQKVKK